MDALNPINVTVLLAVKANRQEMTEQQYRTLRGQVLSGNAEGALKGLRRILRRKRSEEVDNDCK